MPGERNEAYVRARTVLLNVLEALQDHRQAVLLVGAQAIYLHTGQGDLAVAPYTSDADLALNPVLLADNPKLAALLSAAGFVRAADPSQIGTWIGAHGVPIDLMVPEAVGGAGRRSADLGPHGNRVARKARGLEAALVDQALVTIGSLEVGEARSIEVLVAGPTALLVAKLHKIWERRTSPRRQEDKDALDVYRLLQAVPTEELADRLGELLSDPLASEVSREAVGFLETLFGRTEAEGIQMTVRATEGLEDPDRLAASCSALAEDLLAAVKR